MRDNLMFDGIPEGGSIENCEALVKQLCVETLEITEARRMIYDRVHRVGTAKQVSEKSRECHNHKPQPFPDTKRKRKQTKPNKRKSNKHMKSTKVSSLFP